MFCHYRPLSLTLSPEEKGYKAARFTDSCEFLTRQSPSPRERDLGRGQLDETLTIIVLNYLVCLSANWHV